jgi:hypothetical protein
VSDDIAKTTKPSDGATELMDPPLRTALGVPPDAGMVNTLVRASRSAVNQIVESSLLTAIALTEMSGVVKSVRFDPLWTS